MEASSDIRAQYSTRPCAFSGILTVFNKFKQLKERPYWGNHFWSKGYCVDTVGLNEEMVQKYVKYQEDKDKREEKK